MGISRYGPRLGTFPGVIVLSAAAILVLTMIFVLSTPNLPSKLRHATSFGSRIKSRLPGQCAFNLVYVKPPKTAGTFIQKVITNWTKGNGRPNFICAAQALETNLYLHECLPRDIKDSCGVFNSHIVVDRNAARTLAERMPNYRLLTSTRNAAQRVVSVFLQKHLLVAHANNTVEIHDALRGYLNSSKFKPWTLYNYYTGDGRTGNCPLTPEDKDHIDMLVGKYDIVIDANIPDESNTILKYHGLFQLPIQVERVNQRGAWNLILPHDLQKVLFDVSCVDRAIHAGLQLRMASLYEQATGLRCVVHGRRGNRSSCIGDAERLALKKNWVF